MIDQRTAPTRTIGSSTLEETQFVDADRQARQIHVDFATGTIDIAAKPDDARTTIAWPIPNVPPHLVTELVQTLIPHAKRALAGATTCADAGPGAFRVAFTGGADGHLARINAIVDAFYRRWMGRPVPREVVSDCADCALTIRCHPHLGRWVEDRDGHWRCRGGSAHRPVEPFLPRGPRWDHRPWHDIEAVWRNGVCSATCTCGRWSAAGPASQIHAQYLLHVEAIPPGAPFST